MAFIEEHIYDPDVKSEMPCNTYNDNDKLQKYTTEPLPTITQIPIQNILPNANAQQYFNDPSLLKENE